jgi:hypothetical protein
MSVPPCACLLSWQWPLRLYEKAVKISDLMLSNVSELLSKCVLEELVGISNVKRRNNELRAEKIT